MVTVPGFIVLFNSPVFLGFALCFFLLWFALPGQRPRLALLVAGSFVFYGYWDWRFIFLLLGSGLVDFFVARLIERSSRPDVRFRLLLLSIVVNLSILGSFKYLGFFAESARGVFELFGGKLEPPDFFLRIILPVGISFYTFQSMSYTIDVYRNRIPAARSLLHFFGYLAMFPQLVAGPIERAGHLLPQLLARRTPTGAQCWSAWRLLVIGYAKKCVIADNIAPFVDDAFAAAATHHSGAFWWLVAAMFATQIYCDFSGYCDIGRGLAKLMGLELMINFDQPYQSSSFREFWTRWHISLSQWFRDYVYIPLGGNRGGALRTHVNLWITMLLSGLWHGAGWTFLAWAGLHAFYLSVERLTQWPRRLEALGALGAVLGRAIVLIAVLVAWIIFRAESIGQAGSILALMFTPTSFVDPVQTWSYALLAVIAAALASLYSSLARRARLPLSLRAFEPVVLPLLVVITIYFRGSGHAFIYFQF